MYSVGALALATLALAEGGRSEASKRAVASERQHSDWKLLGNRDKLLSECFALQ
jgi:hypothetical protein